MNTQDIIWLTSEVPAEKREGALRHMGMQIGDIKAYHVTSAENAITIRKQGIKAMSSQQSYDRPEATYFFLEKSEINDANKAILLDDPGDAAIIEVIIPRNEFLNKAQWDGLYNVSFGESRSAIQFFGSIPQSWIVKVK